MRAWSRPVEQIMLAAVESKTRVLGIVSPDRSAGVSTLCTMIAGAYARAGARTLLVDLSQSKDGADGTRAWAPGSSARESVETHPDGFETLAARPAGATRSAFNNVDAMRRMLNDELSDFNAIIVDLPAVLDHREDIINPAAAGRACDAVIMVCVAGEVSRPRIKATISALDAAGVRLGGTVFNDLHHPPLGADIAHNVHGMRFMPRRVSAWLERKVLSSEFLNSSA